MDESSDATSENEQSKLNITIALHLASIEIGSFSGMTSSVVSDRRVPVSKASCSTSIAKFSCFASNSPVVPHRIDDVSTSATNMTAESSTPNVQIDLNLNIEIDGKQTD